RRSVCARPALAISVGLWSGGSPRSDGRIDAGGVRMRQILRGRAVIGLLCAVPIAYLAISLSGPALERYRAERRERAAKEHAKQQVLETWNAAAFVPLDAASAEQLTEEIAEAVEDRGPALAQLRADQREA